MPKIINDKFARMEGISRQRRYQLRKEACRGCRICGLPVARGSKLCVVHRDQSRQHRADARARDKRPGSELI